MTTWLITGCSTGLGRALATAVLAAGDTAVVTARSTSSVQDFHDSYPDTALALALDVTDSTQVANAVAEAEKRFGAIDVLVNNAGYGYRAAVDQPPGPGVIPPLVEMTAHGQHVAHPVPAIQRHVLRQIAQIRVRRRGGHRRTG